jgi:dCTP deaminase
MILNGAEIISEYNQGKIHIDPFTLDQVGPNSYDVRLGSHLKVVTANSGNFIDPDKKQTTNIIELPWVLSPEFLYLGNTIEAIGSDYYVPMLEGRSSIGRMGLAVHITAGFGDIGFKQQWTLEMTCELPFKVFPGMRIAQVSFYGCSSRTMMYDGRYMDQEGVQESLFWRNK